MSKTLIKIVKNLNQSGFTLVEMSIVIAILGLLVGGALSFYKPLDQNFRATQTKDNMDKIARAMSSYALRNNRIPCPASPAVSQTSPSAEPFGAELGSGADADAVGSCTASQSEGIVPYRTLGLRQEDIIDGYGGYFTYRVSPAFANTPSGDTVHDSCRSAKWMNSSNDNINPDKARFCCAPRSPFSTATDIVVTDTGGIKTVPTRSGGQGNLDVISTSSTGSPLTVVYVLVSHGANQFGKFLVNETTDRYPEDGVVGDDEKENQNGDIDFVDSFEVMKDTTAHYDDFILWRTQDSLLSELGTNSCAIP